MASSPARPTIPPQAASAGASPSSSGEYLLQLLQQGRSSGFSLGDSECSSSLRNHSSFGDGGDNIRGRHHSLSSTGSTSFTRSSSMEASLIEEDQARFHLQQRSGWPEGGSGSFSKTSSMEVSAIEEEQARLHLQRDPAVAALGPSHRLGEFNNSGANINRDRRGILPFQDQQSFPQQHHHQQHPHLNLPVSLSPTLDVPFCPSPSEHLLPSPLDPLFRRVPNQYVRPYLYPQFPVVDHNRYLCIPPPSFPHTGVHNPSRLQDMTCTFPYSASEQPKPFMNLGIASPQNVACLDPPRVVADAELLPLTEQVSVVTKAQFFTQFGSIGVEIDQQSVSKGSAGSVLLPFQQSFPLNEEGAGVSPLILGSKVNIAKCHSPVGPLKPLNEGTVVLSSRKGDVEESYSPVSALKLEEQHLPQNSKASADSAVSSCFYVNQKKILEPSAAKRSNHTGSLPSISLEGAEQGPSLRMHVFASGTETSQGKECGLVDNHIDATNITVKVVDGEIRQGMDFESKPRSKGPQKGLDSLRKGAMRNGSGHWVAVMKDKKDEATCIGMEAAGSLEKMSVKPSDDARRQRGQTQGWRLKKASAGNAQLQSPNVSSIKSVNSANRIGRSRPKTSLQQDPVGLPSGTKVDSAPSSATEQSKQALQTSSSMGPPLMAELDANFPKTDGNCKDAGNEENVETILDCVGFLELDKDVEAEEETRSASRPLGSSISESVTPNVKQSENRVVRPKFNKREAFHRLDAEKCTNQFLSIFQTLIPPVDEEQKRKQLLSTLDELVSGIWPEARLYLFGSCANSFGVCNSDIDVCLSIDGESSTRLEVVRTLADVLTANRMQNVQALTHARVPIVKYSDPTTGISCDVCVNNMLAVVNTKLLHDYAQIDVRLRQLAFMVKHWAKCRQVNETYRGTLSSYAYVLMCIHFLQQRKPPVLPCLQELEPTYRVTVGEIHCAYFDRVDRLKDYGQRNKETLADLVTSFFDYWAFRHDYSHTVISIRTLNFLSKAEKDWTRRIGNERHLICIEDPFEVSHDLGRVVDKHSIRVLRDEFQRAAKIMRHDPNPCVALFEPYVRQKSQAA